ncbi:acid protease [Exidia glandulosa HHB12029]|uniref:Acid protease n=1 Tax=Exidia glandulosa HHB12029 TaxID=1314781 RepID=A0A165B7P5_EXIGL|nr:acid protease [Exidia glandulosa HHB12029]
MPMSLSLSLSVSVLALLSLSAATSSGGVELRLSKRTADSNPTKPWHAAHKGPIRIETLDNNAYTTDITIGNTTFTVQLDTGSSDLWFDHSQIPFDDPSIGGQSFDLSPISLDYVKGSVVGVPGQATVSFGKYTIQNQAMFDVQSITDISLSGILGVGFNEGSLIQQALSSSGVPATLQQAAKSGNTFLANIFAQSPWEGNFTTILLGRENEYDGLFTINHIPAGYTAVINQPALTVIANTDVPGAERYWFVSVDSFTVGGTDVSTQSIYPNAPSGQAIALLDTGTSLSYVSLDIWKAVYGSIPGAVVLSQNGEFGSVLVPCLARISVYVNFEKQSVFMEPRDVVVPIVIPTSGGDVTVCLNSFVTPAAPLPANDYILGDNFLRNVFQIYRFNNVVDYDPASTETPNIQLLPLSREIEDDAAYLAQRQEDMKPFPPIADLSDPAVMQQIVNFIMPTASAPAASDVEEAAVSAPARTFAADAQPSQNPDLSDLTAQVHSLAAAQNHRDPLIVGLLAGCMALTGLMIGVVIFSLLRQRQSHAESPKRNFRGLTLLGEGGPPAYKPVKTGEDTFHVERVQPSRPPSVLGPYGGAGHGHSGSSGSVMFKVPESP